ncbi:AAWKG family protein [Streptomyces sp. NPDC057236]|uniref:AAWKG family protein n=1 Tax=Streptomyces sp. NPDC057236 TaxID=3346059 RepID=UPI0036298181
MANPEDNNDDYWKKAVDLLTGYVLPERKTLFDTLKGNDDIPMIHVRVEDEGGPGYSSGFLSSGGWGTHNTNYTIPYYQPAGNGTDVSEGSYLYRYRVYITFLATPAAAPPSGEDVIAKFEKTSKVLMDKGGSNSEGEKLDWDTSALVQYIYGSKAALDQLTMWPYSTHGFENRGIKVGDATYVDLLTFTKTAQAFDRVVKFFEDSAVTIGKWDTENIGEGSDSWDGTSAAIFKELIHKLARNYEGYADQLDGKGTDGSTVTIDTVTVTSEPARALAAAQAVVLEQAQNLRDAWVAWRAESNPQRWLYDMLQDARFRLIDNQFDNTDFETVSSGSGPYTTWHNYVVSTANFRNEIVVGEKSYGKPSDMTTWKAIADEAVRRWEQSVQDWLSTKGAEAIVAINKAFKEAEKAFDTSITDKDDRPLSEISAKEEAAAEKKKAEAEAAAAKAAAEKEKAEAKAEAEKEKAEAKAERDKEKAEAEKEKAEAKAEAEKEKAEAKAERDKEKAEAEKEKAEAKAAAEKEKAEAKAEQEKEKAEAKAEQEAAKAAAEKEKAEAKAEQEKEKAEAKAEQEAAKEEAEKEKAEAKAEQAAAKEEAEKEKAEAKQAAAQQQAFVLAQNQKAQDEAKKERERAAAQAEADRAEAKAEQEAAKAEAEKEKAEAKAEQEAEKAEAKREQEAAKAQAEQEKAEAKAEQEAAKAEAKAEQEAAKAEAKAEQEAAKAEAEKEKAEAKAEQEAARAEAKQEQAAARAEAEREQEAARAEADAEREAAKRDQADAQSRAEAQQEEARREALQERQQARLDAENAKADAQADYEQQKAEARAERDAVLQEADRQETAARQEYEREKAEAQEQRDQARQDAEQERAEARREYEREIAAGADEEEAREEYDRRIAEIDAAEREALERADAAEAEARSEYDQAKADAQAEREEARTEAEQARKDAKAEYDRRMAGIQAEYDRITADDKDIDELIRQRIADLPEPPDLSAYNGGGSTGSAGSAYSSVFDDNLYNQDDLASALGRPQGGDALAGASADGTGTGAGSPGMYPPMMRGAGGEAGGNSGERTRTVIEPGVGRSGRTAAAQTVGDEEHRVVPRSTQTSSSTPFMPPMGGMGGAGERPQTESGDRERTTWLAEDEDVWGTDEGGAPQALGR